MKNENLVIVHSFPTNSILLKGLVDFLEDHVNLFFVDLPGFAKKSPPLKKITMEGFAEYLESAIDSFDLEHYILGGISFGYLVVSQTRIDERCKAILAMEPFLGVRSLFMGRAARIALGTFARIASATGLAPVIWRNPRFKKRMLKRGEPKKRVETMLEELDPRTYFETAAMLVNYDRALVWRNLPHVLIVNPDDETINAENVAEVFREHVRRLLVLETTIAHYPEDLTKEYFADRITKRHLDALIDFIERYGNNGCKDPYYETVGS